MKMMKTFSCLVSAAVLSLVGAALAYDCQTVDTTIGDRDVLVIGGYTFARPIEFDFAPTNAPSTNVSYTAEFRLVYLNDELPRATEENLGEVLGTGSLLNGWLREFLEEQYSGADFEELMTKYFDKSLAADINEKFPAYLEPKLMEFDASASETIHSVTVNVTARGAFKQALLRRLAESRK